MVLFSWAFVSVALAGTPAAPTVGDLRKVGTVHLKSSCAPAVQKELGDAVALLHSFFYDEARRRFEGVAARDPQCAMAQWGIAMTWWHPIWTPPLAEEMAAGRAAIAKAKTIGGRTPVEQGYIAALDAFYTRPHRRRPARSAQSCHGPTGGGDHPARALAYEKAMEAMFVQHPEEVEVGAFYALALLGTAPPTDKTLKNQRPGHGDPRALLTGSTRTTRASSTT